MKLRTKLLIYITMPFILAVTMIAYENYRQSFYITRQSSENAIKMSASFVAENMNLIFSNIQSSLVILSETPIIHELIEQKDIDRGFIKLGAEYLKSVQPYLTFSKDIFLLDAKGNIIISTNSLDYGQNYGDREYFKQSMQNKFYISEVLISRSSQKETMYMSSPVWNNGEIASVLVVSMQLVDLVRASYENLLLTPATQVFLLNRNDEIIASSKSSSLYPVQSLRSLNIYNCSLSENVVLPILNDVKYTGYFKKLKNQAWSVVAIISDSEMLSLTSKAAFNSMKFALMAIAAVIAILFVFVVNLTNSLGKCVKFAKNISDGDFSSRLDIYVTDEIGQLANSLRSMVSSLRQSKEILQFTVDLRTRELAQAQENLYRESFINKIILYHIPDIVFHKDLNGVYTSCNRAFCEYVGKDKEDILGKTDAELFATFPGGGLDYSNADQEVYDSPQKLMLFEEELVYPNGEHVIVETIKNVYCAESGEALGLVGIARNISQRKETEKALALANLKAVEASQAKSEFLARMSHEIRTPLNAIIGLNYLLCQISHEPKQLEYLYKVDLSAKNLLAIINDILDFSKIEAGKMSIEKIPFCLNSAIQEVVDINESKAKEQHTQIIVEIDSKVENSVLGDRLRLNQILLNLVSNALKFTKDGVIYIKLHLEKDDSEQQTCLFIVQDTGEGMSEEQCSRLFTAFSQADNSITRKHGGTGLGLSICRLLVELMGGAIWLETKLGEGSTFFFRLIFDKNADAYDCSEPSAELANSHNLSQSHIDFSTKHVLLVEDNPINQEIAIEILKLIGVQVSLANNGLEALEMIGKNHYDLVLMDIQMPIMDGYEATRLLRQNPKYQGLPIIAMTANAQNSDRNNCLAVGMNEHISKPFDPLQLKLCLEFWLGAGGA